jgi:lipopolysaccharide transport system permease protein
VRSSGRTQGPRAFAPSDAWPSRVADACCEIRAAVCDLTIWKALAQRDIKARYRRTVLGPLWIVILVVTSAAAIALVYGLLLGQPFGTYFVFVAASLVSWSLISNILSEAASLFWLSGTLMKSFQVSPIALLLGNLCKNVIVWGHAILPALVVSAVVMTNDIRAVSALPIGLVLVLLNLGWIGLVIALLGARFRDLHDLVITILSLAFLVTPVIWDASMLGDYAWLANVNPLAHLLDLLRRPVLGQWPSLTNVMVATVTAAIGWPFAIAVFTVARSRLPLWI